MAEKIAIKTQAHKTGDTGPDVFLMELRRLQRNICARETKPPGMLVQARHGRGGGRAVFLPGVPWAQAAPGGGGLLETNDLVAHLPWPAPVARAALRGGPGAPAALCQQLGAPGP